MRSSHKIIITQNKMIILIHDSESGLASDLLWSALLNSSAV